MEKYQHKVTEQIIKAELFNTSPQRTYEYKVITKDFFFFKFKKYYLMLTYPEIEWVRVSKKDYVILFGDKYRIYTMVYPKKIFEKRFIKLEED